MAAVDAPRPFRFGANIRSTGVGADFVAAARKLEDLGYSTLLVPDHLTQLLAPMPALVGAAAATRTLRVGTHVLNNDFRHPVVLAREAATVDVLTGGRLELGLGAGHMQWEYEQAGLGFDPGPVRVERLAEAVTIITELFAGKAVTFAGRHYRVTDHTLHPLPVQRPRPPIMIGGHAPRVLTVAAQHADIVGFTGIVFRRGGAEVDVAGFKTATVDDRVRLVREVARARPEPPELSVLVQRVVLTDDRRHAADELAARWPALTADDVLASPFLLVGTVDQMAEDLRLRRERWGLSYFVTHEQYVDALAPVVGRVAGE